MSKFVNICKESNYHAIRTLKIKNLIDAILTLVGYSTLSKEYNDLFIVKLLYTDKCLKDLSVDRTFSKVEDFNDNNLLTQHTISYACCVSILEMYVAHERLNIVLNIEEDFRIKVSMNLKFFNKFTLDTLPKILASNLILIKNIHNYITFIERTGKVYE